MISKGPIPDEELGLKALSMVMMDWDYNGEYFDMDEKWFASELAGSGYEVRFAPGNVGARITIIHIGVYGNKRKEVEILKAFRRRA